MTMLVGPPSSPAAIDQKLALRSRKKGPETPKEFVGVCRLLNGNGGCSGVPAVAGYWKKKGLSSAKTRNNRKRQRSFCAGSWNLRSTYGSEVPGVPKSLRKAKTASPLSNGRSNACSSLGLNPTSVGSFCE